MKLSNQDNMIFLTIPMIWLTTGLYCFRYQGQEGWAPASYLKKGSSDMFPPKLGSAASAHSYALDLDGISRQQNSGGRDKDGPGNQRDGRFDSRPLPNVDLRRSKLEVVNFKVLGPWWEKSVRQNAIQPAMCQSIMASLVYSRIRIAYMFRTVQQDWDWVLAFSHDY